MGTFVKGIVISLNVRNCESARFKIQSREDQRGQDIRDIMESYSHLLPSILSEVPTRVNSPGGTKTIISTGDYHKE